MNADGTGRKLIDASGWARAMVAEEQRDRVRRLRQRRGRAGRLRRGQAKTPHVAAGESLLADILGADVVAGRQVGLLQGQSGRRRFRNRRRFGRGRKEGIQGHRAEHGAARGRQRRYDDRLRRTGQSGARFDADEERPRGAALPFRLRRRQAAQGVSRNSGRLASVSTRPGRPTGRRWCLPAVPPTQPAAVGAEKKPGKKDSKEEAVFKLREVSAFDANSRGNSLLRGAVRPMLDRARQGGQSVSQAEIEAAAIRQTPVRSQSFQPGGDGDLLCARRVGRDACPGREKGTEGRRRRRKGTRSRARLDLRPRSCRVTTGCTSTRTAIST